MKKLLLTMGYKSPTHLVLLTWHMKLKVQHTELLCCDIFTSHKLNVNVRPSKQQEIFLKKWLC